MPRLMTPRLTAKGNEGIYCIGRMEKKVESTSYLGFR